MPLRLLALAVFLAPLAASAQSVFGDNCHLTIEREINQVPFDNLVKYGTLLVLAGFPETSPAAIALGREEVASDVRVAALKGAAACLRDPGQRERALQVIALAKATDDWAGFAFDLRNATGLGPEQMLGSEVLAKVSITSAILDDLGAGGTAVRDGYDALGRRRALSFQTALQIHADLARQFGFNCQWTASARLADGARALVRERRPGAVTEMIRASEALTGRAITSEADLLAFEPTPYLNTNARAVSDFLGARGDYILSDRVLADLDGLAEEMARTRPQVEDAQRRVDAHLRDARRAFEQCNPPRMQSAMRLISQEPGVIAYTPINQRVSLLMGFLSGEFEVFSDAELRVSLAGSNGCWAEPVQTYNTLVTDYYRLREVNVPGRDEAELAAALARGRRALGACDGGGARGALAEARVLLPASLDPGNLCMDVARAEADVLAFEREIEPALAACTATPDPLPLATEGLVSCPAPPRGFELRATQGFGEPNRQPGEILVDDTGFEKRADALCSYRVAGQEFGGFSVRAQWLERPSGDGSHYCRGASGEPLIQSRGMWSLSFSGKTTEEWRGPYSDQTSIGVSFSLIYSSHQRLAYVRMSEHQEGTFRDFARSDWREAAATHLIREVSARAWRCPG